MNNLYKKRIFGLDIIRIILAFGVFLYHTNSNDRCYYGFLTPLINKLNYLMVPFFMLSGFVLYKRYQDDNLVDIKRYIYFIKKRLICIMPIYIFVLLVIKISNSQNEASFYFSIPIEMLGLQSIFPSSLDNITPNAGTWFISCIVICYFLFPFLLKLVQQFENEKNIYFFVFCIIIYCFAFSHIAGNIKLYRNLFIRILEFFEGVLLAKFKINNKQRRVQIINIIFEIFAYIMLITLINSGLFSLPFNAVINEAVTLLVFSYMIISFSTIKINKDIKIVKNLSEMSYYFYISQVLVYCNNSMHIKFMNFLKINLTNINKIIFSFIFCFAISMVLYEFDNRIIKKLINKIILYN